jgi:hypothetical protein
VAAGCRSSGACPRIAFRQHLVAVCADHARLAGRLCHGSLAYPKTLGSLRFFQSRIVPARAFSCFVCPHQNTLSALSIIYQIDSWDAHGAGSYSRIGRLCVLCSTCGIDCHVGHVAPKTSDYCTLNMIRYPIPIEAHSLLSRHRTIPRCLLRLRSAMIHTVLPSTQQAGSVK